MDVKPKNYNFPVALQEEKDRSCMYAEELAKLELKFKEQLKTNESLKLQLAAEEDRYKVSSADGPFTHTVASFCSSAVGQ